jgi:putative endonuclease
MGEKKYHIYMLSNRYDTVIYIGVTGDLVKRIWQHKQKEMDGFTKRYNVDKLVYYEEYAKIYDAIAREKQLKGWTRKKKENLIDTLYPQRRDLYKEII